MDVGILVSGGKDSAYAHWLASQKGYDIVKLITMIPKVNDSWMFQQSNPKIMDLYSQTTETPIIKKTTPGEKESEINDLKNALEGLEIEGIVTGVVNSNYQRERVQKICEEIGIEMITPIWKKDPSKLLKNMIEEGFVSTIVSVSAKGLDEKWLSREINKKNLKKLKKLNQKYKIHISGEGGEYETLALNSPLFKKRIKITKAKKVWDGMRGRLEIEDAKLAKK